jgi:hypothetical protein
MKINENTVNELFWMAVSMYMKANNSEGKCRDFSSKCYDALLSIFKEAGWMDAYAQFINTNVTI